MTDYLSSAIRSGVTKKAGVVYRCLDGAPKAILSKVGKKIVIGIVLSTSKDEEFAKRQADGALLRIYIPKDAHALEVAQIVGHDPAKEVILPNNSKFTVHAVSKEDSGRYIVDLIMHR